MAIPSSFFESKYGVALMRYDHSLSEWFFECWANKRVVIRDLEPGNHTFQLWLILGNSVPGVVSIRHNAWTNIYVMKNRK